MSDPLENMDDIEKETKPLEVKVVNEKKVSKTVYDSKDDEEHSDINITAEEVEEFENGDSSS